jgi:aminoglycoside 6'-N-acetyltransferase
VAQVRNINNVVEKNNKSLVNSYGVFNYVYAIIQLEVVYMDNIELINLRDDDQDYKLLHKWCSNKFVYEWFEQRVLSYEEIVNKYRNKLLEGKQKLFLINYNDNPIGLVQIYKYDDLIFDELKEYNNIYEYDIFIGESDYLHKGIGTKVVDFVNKYIYDNYSADCVVLRPFKRNINAISCYQKNNFHIINEYDGKDTLGNNERIVVLINNQNNNPPAIK